MEALPPLARAHRYGDVRGTDTSALRQVAEVLVRADLRRPAAGGRRPGRGRRRGTMRRRIDAVQQRARTADRRRVDDRGRPDRGDDLRRQWLTTLGSLVDRTDVPGVLLGRMVRLLLDADG